MSDFVAVPALRNMKGLGEGAGVRARLRSDLPIVSVLARTGRNVADQLGIAEGPRKSSLPGMTALGIGPERWLFVGRPIAALRSELQAIASLSDHSDGYALFELWGPNVRDALAKGVPVDLHPDIFSNDVAVTLIAHMGAIVWQSDTDRFTVAVFRSYAGSFWHWLSASAAAFGLVVEEA